MAFVNIDYFDLKSEPYDFSLLKKITRGRTHSLSNDLTVDENVIFGYLKPIHYAQEILEKGLVSMFVIIGVSIGKAYFLP
jgi:hypothetical protein